MWIDLVCPYSYINKRLFEEALEMFEYREHVCVMYKSYLLYEKSWGIQRPAYAQHLLAMQDSDKEKQFYTYAENFGMNDPFKHADQRIDTLDAHRLIKYAASKNKEKQMIDALLEAHFFHNQSIEEHVTLCSLGASIGLCELELSDLLPSCKYTSNVRNDDMQATEIGVEHIPFIVLNDTCGIPTMHTTEEFRYILHEIWKEQKAPIIYQKKSNTTYCTEEGCHESYSS